MAQTQDSLPRKLYSKYKLKTTRVITKVRSYYNKQDVSHQNLFKYLTVSIIVAFILFFGYLFYTSQYVYLNGNVEIRSINLAFRVGGRIDALYKEEGDIIKVGDILGLLDNETYKNNYEQFLGQYQAMQARNNLVHKGYRTEDIQMAKSNLTALESSYNYAKNNYERHKKLALTKSTTQERLEAARAAFQQAESQLNNAKLNYKLLSEGFREEEIAEADGSLLSIKASLANAKISLDDTTLISPIDGIIQTRTLEPGSIISPGTVIYNVALYEPLYVRCYVTSLEIEDITQGGSATISTDGGNTYNGVIGFYFTNC